MTEKVQPIFPRTSINLGLKVDGLFAYPDQWKTTDQANPGMFTYIVKFTNMEIAGGKIYPRQLTEKQVRQQQQAKNKKGGKKQAKKDQNPAEAERLRELLQKQQAEEKKKEQLWSKLTEQQRFHSSSQDKNKAALLRFEKNSIQKLFEQNSFVILEEHILKDGGEWIYIFKVPTANQEELAKLRKAKPKTLNLNDLNAVSMRAWVDLTSLRSTTVKETSVRCKIHQVDAVEETPKPNLEKAYIKVSVTLSEPLLTKQDPYTTNNIIKDPPQPKAVPEEIKCVDEMKQQMRLAIESLAMQYSGMFWKELNANQQQKSSQIFVSNKKNQHLKRKQQFLYDFNISGKYKVLKERLKRVIVHLCEHKFADKMEGAKSFTGITCSVRDQFYSEIYNFLVASYSETMEELVEQKKQKLREVFVLNQANQNMLTEDHLQRYKKQTQEQRFMRVVRQYNLVGNFEYGQNMYKGAISKQPNNFNLKYQYSIFCIKNGLNTVAEVLSWGYIEQYLERNKQDNTMKLEYILLMIGSEQSKSLKKAWILIRQLINQDLTKIQLLLYASIIAQVLGKNEVSAKLTHKAYRQKLRNTGAIKSQGKHKEQPLNTQIPSASSLATYSTALKNEDKDEEWGKIIQKLSQLGLYNIIQKVRVKISGQNNPIIKKQSIKILFYQQQYAECKQKSLELYNATKDFDLMQIAIKCCQKLNQDQDTQKYLKLALKIASKQKKFEVLLNLAYFYLQAAKYGNAKACVLKYLEGNAMAGGLSWQILGISQLKSNNFNEALESLRHSNLSDPYNKEVWIWMAVGYSKINNFIMVNQCLNCYSDTNEQKGEKERKKLTQLKQNISSAKTQTFYESSIKSKLLQRLQTY